MCKLSTDNEKWLIEYWIQNRSAITSSKYFPNVTIDNQSGISLTQTGDSLRSHLQNNDQVI